MSQAIIKKLLKQKELTPEQLQAVKDYLWFCQSMGEELTRLDKELLKRWGR